MINIQGTLREVCPGHKWETNLFLFGCLVSFFLVSFILGLFRRRRLSQEANGPSLQPRRMQHVLRISSAGGRNDGAVVSYRPIKSTTCQGV